MGAIIFFAIAILIFLICFYAWRDVYRQYPPDYSDSTYSYKRVFKGTLIGLIIVPVATLLYPVQKAGCTHWQGIISIYDESI